MRMASSRAMRRLHHGRRSGPARAGSRMTEPERTTIGVPRRARRRAPRRARARRRAPARRRGLRSRSSPGRRRRADPRRAVRGRRRATPAMPGTATSWSRSRRRRRPRSSRLRPGAVLIGFLDAGRPETSARSRRKGVTAFAMEAIPRISRAQADGRPVVAGDARRLQGRDPRRRARDPAAADDDHRRGHDPARPSARAGRRGRRAAGARDRARLGASTTGYDVRPETAEQVRSVGADWLELGIEAAGEGGYARELTDAERAAQQQALTDAIKTFDIVITTALVPGRPAPRARDRRGGGGHAPGQRDRRPRRRDRRQLRADRAGRVGDRHSVTIAAPLNLAATRARARLPALRPQRAGAARAAARRGRGPHRPRPTRSSPARASPARRRGSGGGLMLVTNLGDAAARRVRRLPGDLQGPQHAAHAADVGHQRDPRDRDRRRHPRCSRPAPRTTRSARRCSPSPSCSGRSTSSAGSWSPTGCSRCSSPPAEDGA